MEWIEVTGNARRSPQRPDRISRPRFSPDGSQIALLIPTPDSRDEWVYDLRLDSLRKVTYGEPPSISTPAWSPDSRYLFLGSGNGEISGIYLVQADGSSQHPERLLQTQSVVFPDSYSREAKRLAYYGLGVGRDGPSSGDFHRAAGRREQPVEGWKSGAVFASIAVHRSDAGVLAGWTLAGVCDK